MSSSSEVSSPSSQSPPREPDESESTTDPRGPTTPPSATDLIKEAFEITRERPGDALGYPLVALLLGGITQFIAIMTLYIGVFLVVVSLSQETSTFANVASTVLVGVVGLLIAGIVAVGGGLIAGASGLAWLRIFRGQKLGMRHLKHVWLRFNAIGVASAIMMFCSLVGYLLLFVPGVVVALGLSMTVLLIVDKGLSGTEAIKESWNLMSGHKLAFLVTMLLVGLLGMAVHAVTCGLGGFAALPFQFGVWTLFYDYLVEPGNEYVILD